jgi:hypothetical protein
LANKFRRQSTPIHLGALHFLQLRSTTLDSGLLHETRPIEKPRGGGNDKPEILSCVLPPRPALAAVNSVVAPDWSGGLDA